MRLLQKELLFYKKNWDDWHIAKLDNSYNLSCAVSVLGTNAKILLAGNSNETFVSSDCQNWTKSVSSSDSVNINGICGAYTYNDLLAVGSGGVIYKANETLANSNTVTWTKLTTSSNYILTSAFYSSPYYYAIGYQRNSSTGAYTPKIGRANTNSPTSWTFKTAFDNGDRTAGLTCASIYGLFLGAFGSTVSNGYRAEVSISDFAVDNLVSLDFAPNQIIYNGYSSPLILIGSDGYIRASSKTTKIGNYNWVGIAGFLANNWPGMIVSDTGYYIKSNDNGVTWSNPEPIGFELDTANFEKVCGIACTNNMFLAATTKGQIAYKRIS